MGNANADLTPGVGQGDADVMPSVTYRFCVHTTSGAIEVYATLCERDGLPCQVTLTTKSAEYAEYLNAVESLITLLFQSGVEIHDIANALRSVHSAFTGHLVKGGWCPSLAARLGQVLLDHGQVSGSHGSRRRS